MNINDSPLFKKTLQCAESFAATYLVPGSGLTEWWRASVIRFPEGDARDKALQQVYVSYDDGRVPDPRRYSSVSRLPGSGLEDPFAAQHQAETEYDKACFDQATTIGCDCRLTLQEAARVYKALDCRGTVPRADDTTDVQVAYGEACTIGDHVKKLLLPMLYPGSMRLQRFQDEVHLVLPAGLNLKRTPARLWQTITIFRESNEPDDIIPRDEDRDRNEKVPSYRWRQHKLLGVPVSPSRKKLVDTACKRHENEWCARYPEAEETFAPALRELLTH